MKNRIADRTIFFLAALEIYAPASLFAGPKDNCLPPGKPKGRPKPCPCPGLPTRSTSATSPSKPWAAFSRTPEIAFV